jgi:hypothetical protein
VFAAAARADAESEWVTISVRLGDAGAAVKVKVFRQEDASVMKETILSCLRLPLGTRFVLIDRDGAVVGVSGKLLAGEYTVEVID